MGFNFKMIEGTCACCGKKQSIEIKEEGILDKNVTLQEYYDYVSLQLNFCDECGYVGEDISKLIGPKTKQIVESKEYEEVFDDKFIEKYKKVPNQEYLDFNIGMYEAYAMLCRADNDTLNLAKALATISDMKSTLVGMYYDDKIDKDNEKLNPVYDSLCADLNKQSIKENAECLEILKNIKIDNPYIAIFIAERLTKLRTGDSAKNYEQARKIIADVKKQVEFDEELEEFIDEMLTEVEVVR